MPDELSRRTSPIVVGESDRASVRGLLGQPWLASEHWRFDLFRSNDHNSTVFWVAFVPVGLSTQDVRGYVLVSYDERGKVKAFASGAGREASILSETHWTAASMQAGDVAFWESSGGDARHVAVDSARGSEYLKRPVPAGRCRLLIGTDGNFCGTRITIDRAHPMQMPPADYQWLQSMLPVDVAAGSHDLAFKPVRWMCSFDAAATAPCGDGESAYVAVTFPGGGVMGPGGFKVKFTADVSVNRDRPDSLRDHGLIIYSNGQWLVPQEPDR